ncbi:MAG: D-alanine--D-alanine ligase, partial [Bacteroidota bacterium]
PESLKKHIAIVMGGYSREHPISLQSGNVVKKYLDTEKYIAYPVIIERNSWYHTTKTGKNVEIDRRDFSLLLPEGKIRFDCVFNTVHGTPGEDGLLQAYFELLGIPQTTCDSYQAALAFNKRDSLSVLKAHGIPCATSYYLNAEDTIKTEEIIDKVGLPCFVKPNRAGSSFGISKVHTADAIKQAIADAFEEDDEILIESFLEGTEVSVGVIMYQGKPLVLPITEIVSENEFFDYEAKYEGKSQEITPARISEAQRLQVSQMALKIFTLLKMSGYTRSEFIFQKEVPYLLEVNTNPGLTEKSILPQQANAAGISLPELFASAIETAINR